MPTDKKFEKYAKLLNPIDDLMFCKMAEHKEFCEEILKVILEDEGLTVIEAISQWQGKNLSGRSVVLDAKCVTGDGRQINIEVQKADDDNHLKRARYNAAILTTNVSETGKRFDFIPDVCIVFISKFDIFDGGLPLYHIDKVVRETGQVIEDGLTEIFVNTVNYDGSKPARLMKLFTENDAYNSDDFPVTSELKSILKSSEGGNRTMNEIIEKLISDEKRESELLGEKRGREQGIEVGREEGREEGAKNIAKTMIKEGLSAELVMKYTGLSEDVVLALQG
ncbi:Rpn family recombination-promoting nuclease/putative transposase [Catonella massiliensis]|uniref:Rpn family recombination-promoting nuclease/putative transposase n=1 Tax=Catonella massiliensis TaxID=2799636 RepID=A0ABS1IXB0_9FIRM|nr:Rpn family recombination-promoting nuclease/putative transposase [Catonella massiliensis]MBK5896532.1 Rpn family recombination-promoting nuclease/putative transposase [Catonella massiliensis]